MHLIPSKLARRLDPLIIEAMYIIAKWLTSHNTEVMIRA